MAEMTNDFLSKHTVSSKGVKPQYASSDRLDANKNFKYGMLYEEGEVVPRNLNTALDYFFKAVVKGNIEAKVHADAIYAGAMTSSTSFSSTVYDKEKGIALLFEAANLGNIADQKFLRKLNYQMYTD